MSTSQRFISFVFSVLLGGCLLMLPFAGYAFFDNDGDGDPWPDSNGHTPPSTPGSSGNDDDDDNSSSGGSSKGEGIHTSDGFMEQGDEGDNPPPGSLPRGSTIGDDGKVYDVYYRPVPGDPDAYSPIAIPRDNDDDDNNSPPPPPPLCTTGPNLVIEDIHFVKAGAEDLKKAVNAAQLVMGDKYNPVVTIRNRGCLSTLNSSWHRDQSPFGENGRFPVRTHVDFGNNGSFEVGNMNNNQPSISGTEMRDPQNANHISTNPNTRLIRLTAITMNTAGTNRIRVIVDPTNSQASGQTCSGDWGCIKEAGEPSSNTREETFTVTDPSISLNAFLMPTPNSVSNAGNSSPRNISANQQWGLYWGGKLVDFASCTGKGVTNRGDAVNNFTAKKDIGGSSNALRAALPGSEDRTDINISEPGVGNSITYTITCNVLNSSQKVTDTLQLIHNRPAPICDSFTLGPSTITQGSPVYLTWTSSNATQATMSTGVGAIPVNGSRTLYPTRSSSYSITLTNADGRTVGCPVRSVTVNPPPPPRCDQFVVSSSSVSAGTPVWLYWFTTNATAVRISGGVGAVPPDGARRVTPTVTTTYTPTVTNAAGVSVSCRSRRVTVGATTVPPASLTLAANSPVNIGDPINLVWASSNVQPGSCVASGAWSGTKTDDGNQSVTRNSAGVATYTLTCTDLNDEPIDDEVTVQVNVPPDPQCSNGRDDNDPEDTLIDRADPGCWSDPLDPDTYDPNGPNDNSETITPVDIDAIPEPTISLTASSYIVRYGDAVTVNYEIEAEYEMSCELTSSGAPRAVPYETPGVKETGLMRQTNLQGTQEFTMTCTPEVIPGVPLPAVSQTMVVDVIPQAQEI